MTIRLCIAAVALMTTVAMPAIAAADVILVAPSNPVVSIAPILAIGGIRDACTNGTSAPTMQLPSDTAKPFAHIAASN